MAHLTLLACITFGSPQLERIYTHFSCQAKRLAPDLLPVYTHTIRLPLHYIHPEDESAVLATKEALEELVSTRELRQFSITLKDLVVKDSGKVAVLAPDPDWQITGLAMSIAETLKNIAPAQSKLQKNYRPHVTVGILPRGSENHANFPYTTPPGFFTVSKLSLVRPLPRTSATKRYFDPIARVSLFPA